MKFFKPYKGKHRRMPDKPRRRAVLMKSAALIAALGVAAAGFGSAATATVDPDKTKTETVYAILSDDGTYTGATVVNSFAAGGEIVDYGAYTSITNLMGTAAPDISGDKITWPSAATDGHDIFYYQGETDKALPFDIDITYTLSGEPMRLADIAGKSGELKIAFEITNNAGTGEIDEKADKEIYTPFAVQVSLSLSSDVFTVLEIPDNATTMQAGSSMTVAYSSFPLPDDEFAFTLFGQNIEMDPVSIVVLPKAPPGLDSYGDFVDTDEMSEGADEMIDGTGDMMEGIDELLDGLAEMKDGVGDLEDGLDDLADGTAKLSDGVDALYQNARSLSGTAGDFYNGMAAFSASFALFDQGMDALSIGVHDMTVSLSGLNDAAALLDTGVISMGDGIEGVSISNAQMAALAAVVAARYPDADTAALSGGLNLQQEAIDSLVSAGANLETLSASVASGTSDFYTEFSTTFAMSVAGLRESSGTLYASCLELLGGAEGLSYGCSQLKTAIGELKGGVDSLGGADKAADGIPDLIEAIDDMIEGVTELRDGVSELQTDGLTEMKDSLDGLDGYLNKLAEQAQAYGSFMDSRNAHTSTVQFVLKTNGIAAKEEELAPQLELEEAPIGFFGKLADLF